MAVTRRLPVTALVALGALGAGIAATVAEAPGTAGVAWATLAAVALSLMLHGLGLRVMAGVVVALSVLGTLVAVGELPWAIVGFVVCSLGAILWWRHGPSWGGDRRPARSEDDPWKQLDAGQDPTA